MERKHTASVHARCWAWFRTLTEPCTPSMVRGTMCFKVRTTIAISTVPGVQHATCMFLKGATAVSYSGSRCAFHTMNMTPSLLAQVIR